MMCVPRHYFSIHIMYPLLKHSRDFKIIMEIKNQLVMFHVKMLE